MGCSLKEALRTLCGVHHWTYALFWKISRQNPGFLIWEDYYLEPRSDFEFWKRSANVKQENTFQDSDIRIRLLLNKMIIDDHGRTIGEGLVGEVAFTGKHHWVQLENFRREAFPPKVVKDFERQFSAGVQTVAVLPVLPHGVVQFASHLSIMENMGFIYDASCLLLQLGFRHGVLQSDETQLSPRIGAPIFSGYSSLTGDCLPLAGELKIVSSTLNRDSTWFDGRNTMFGNSFDGKIFLDDPTLHKLENLSPSGVKLKIEAHDYSKNDESIDDFFSYNQSRDDLFDVLEAGLKNKLLRSCCESLKTVDSEETCCENSENQIHSDYLLDAVASKSCSPAKHSLDDSGSCKTTITNISSSPLLKDSLHDSPFLVQNHEKNESTGSTKKYSGSYFHCSSIYDSWTGEGLKNDASAGGVSVKRNKLCQKRLKRGENPRPRPKDRQMIQDSVKELREIVPNGAKCSIDTLLGRTIKHMLFLQSVTKYANQLKQTMESKIIDTDLQGATWAYEVGLQYTVCPIVVEDLNQPGQMLIKMLCQEQDLFLDVADMIRGLGLTILKGIMEIRNDKIWACFAVEGNEEITRMEVSVKLVHFLEQNMN